MSWKKPLLALVAVVSVVAIAAVARTQSPDSAPKPGEKPAAAKQAAPNAAPAQAPPAVTVQPAVRQHVSSKHTFVGTVMPKRVSSVGSAVDARVTEFLVNEGDRIEAGKTIAQLLTGQLEIQLAGANAETRLAERELAELEASWPLELEQAQSRLNARKSALEFAAARLNRTKTLYERKTVTADQMEEATSLANQASEAFAEAKAALAIVEGPRKEAIEQARHQVDVKREAANAIEDQIKKHTIKAPFNGYVIEEHTEVGQWVARAGLVAKIAELDEVDVEVMVLENLLPHMKLGMTALVEVTALNKTYEGRVEMIVPQADSQSRNFPVKVRVKNTIEGQPIEELSGGTTPTAGDRYGRQQEPTNVQEQLRRGSPDIKAGMFARVTLEVGYTPDALLVNKDAVVLGGVKPVVYVVDGAAAQGGAQPRTGLVRPVMVELGVEDGNYIAVTGAINPGELVVVEGNERLRPKMPVTIGMELPGKTAN